MLDMESIKGEQQQKAKRKEKHVAKEDESGLSLLKKVATGKSEKRQRTPAKRWDIPKVDIPKVDTRKTDRSNLDAPRDDESESPLSRHLPRTNPRERIHILGTRPTALYIAHSLQLAHPDLDIKMIFRRIGPLNEFKKEGGKILVDSDGTRSVAQGIEAQYATPPYISHGRIVNYQSRNDAMWRPNYDAREPGEAMVHPSDIHLADAAGNTKEAEPTAHERFPDSREPIYNLIFVDQPQMALSSILGVHKRIQPDANILLLNSGLGVTEEICEKIYPDPETRPNLLVGMSNHDVRFLTAPTRQSRNITPERQIQHSGVGGIHLALLARGSTRLLDHRVPYDSSVWPETSNFLINTLCNTTALRAMKLKPTELLLLKLEEVAVLAVTNTIATMMDSVDRTVLSNFYHRRTMRLLIAEISLVLRSLPELRNDPQTAARFDPARLESLAVRDAGRKNRHINTMLSYSRAGRRTAIEYLSGYVISRGEELGVRCFLNYMMMTLVQGKGQTSKLDQLAQTIPVQQAEVSEEGPDIGDPDMVDE